MDEIEQTRWRSIPIDLIPPKTIAGLMTWCLAQRVNSADSGPCVSYNLLVRAPVARPRNKQLGTCSSCNFDDFACNIHTHHPVPANTPDVME